VKDDESKNLSLGDLGAIRSDDLLENSIDPNWLSALERLETEGDSADIGTLLQQHAPPSWVIREIGKMLAPPKKYRGALLKVKLPAISRKVAFAELAKKHNARLLIQKYEGQGYGTEAAVAKVKELTGYMRSILYGIKAMNFEQEFNSIMGNTEESSKN
jgi:hypothetical protein